MNGAAWGGSEQMWYRLALWMSQNGYAVSIVCFDWPQKKERLDVLEKAGCTVHKLPGKKGLLYAVKLKRAIKSIPFEEKIKSNSSHSRAPDCCWIWELHRARYRCC